MSFLNTDPIIIVKETYRSAFGVEHLVRYKGFKSDHRVSTDMLNRDSDEKTQLLVLSRGFKCLYNGIKGYIANVAGFTDPVIIRNMAPTVNKTAVTAIPRSQFCIMPHKK
jgi:hypothetical protein